MGNGACPLVGAGGGCERFALYAYNLKIGWNTWVRIRGTCRGHGRLPRYSLDSLGIERIREGKKIEELLHVKGWRKHTLLNGFEDVPDGEVYAYLRKKSRWAEIYYHKTRGNYFIKVHGALFYESKKRN